MADVQRRAVIGGIALLAVFGVMYVLGLAIVSPIVRSGVDPGNGSSDPRIGLLFLVVLLVGTAGMLAAFRWGLGGLIRGFVIVVATVLAAVVFDALFPRILTVGGVDVAPGLGAILLGVGLVLWPRWYVIDLAGIVIGAGGVALFGLTIGILPALLLLILLAVYDLISVYGTKHMLSLAQGAMASRLPVLLIVPTRWPGRGPLSVEEDHVVVIGLGDAVVPGMLVGSAVVHGPGSSFLVGGIAVTLPAIGTMCGIGLGMICLLAILNRGGAHPGLPLLNGGAIAGYVVAGLVAGIPAAEIVGVA